MKNKYSYLLIFLFTSLVCFSQKYGDSVEISKNNITSWKTSIEKYYDTYSFGSSENKSELKIFGNGSITMAQHQFTRHNGNDWIEDFRTFTNVKIIGSKFYSDQYNGEFIKFKTKNTGRTQEGLHLDTYLTNQYTGQGGEIGSKGKI